MIIPQIGFKKKYFDKQTSLILWIVAFVIFIVIAFTKESIFPNKYFYDSYTIERYMREHLFAFGDLAYANTARFYSILGLTDRFAIIPTISMLLYFGILFKMLTELPSRKIKFSNFLIFVFFVTMAMVYLTTFSKDSLVALFVVFPFFFLYKKPNGHFYIILLSVVYAYFFRQYWFLVAGYFFAFRFLLTKKIPFFYILLLILCSYVFVVTIYNIKLGMNITDIRMGVNENRIGDKDAATAIVNFVPGSNVFSETINVFITFLSLIIPIPLVAFFNPIYLIVFVCLISVMLQLRQAYIEAKDEADLNVGIANCLALLLALLAVQGLFEPDYGSYVRHLSPFYPVMFLLIFPLRRPINRTKKQRTY